MNTIAKVEKYIQDQKLFNKDSIIIVGVSGGADSITMLHILHFLGYKCIAAHCNFHLRGNESDRDLLFTKNVCVQMGIEFVSVDFDTYTYMQEKSLSAEMAARELRYHWFVTIREEYGAEKIAVAHHQDDSVETVLINLVRGTGIKGLTGISPINGNITRPLLCLTRKEIVEYATTNNIEFITDSTNEEKIYTRNKIRLDILPILKTINPSVVQSIIKTAENLKTTEKLYRKAVETSIGNFFSGNVIDINNLLKEEDPQTLIFETLFPFGFNADTIQNIFDSIDSISGKIFYSKEYKLVKDRNKFILQRLTQTNNEVYLIEDYCTFLHSPISLRIENISKEPCFEIEKKAEILYLDKDKISFPMTIRRWKKGDKFIPFGMKGTKKVSDFFSDQKLSLLDKENVWLLCCKQEIVWIVGKRADDRFKITDTTKSIVKISISHKNSTQM